jgi:hypothetical protein
MQTATCKARPRPLGVQADIRVSCISERRHTPIDRWPAHSTLQVYPDSAHQVEALRTKLVFSSVEFMIRALLWIAKQLEECDLVVRQGQGIEP